MFKTMCSHIVTAMHSRMKLLIAFLLVVGTVSVFPVQFVKSVSIHDGAKEVTLYTFNTDAQKILSSAEIAVEESDKVEVTGGQDSDMTITISRAFPVTVTVGGKSQEVKLAGGTVADAIAATGFIPDQYDEINYSLDQRLNEGMKIDVVNVDYQTSVTEKTIAHKTVKKTTTKLKDGQKKVVKAGSDGKRVITTIHKLVNGKVVDASVTEDTVKPVTEEVLVGVSAKKANRKEWMSDLKPQKEILLDKNGVPVNYKRKMTGKASAYCTGTTCSTGVRVKQGYIAVDPNIIPYGTQMYIRTADGSWIYGYAIAADTGGFTAWGNTIADLYMYSYEDAVNFGRRNIEIYIL